jgi:hypothetical protein
VEKERRARAGVSDQTQYVVGRPRATRRRREAKARSARRMKHLVEISRYEQSRTSAAECRLARSSDTRGASTVSAAVVGGVVGVFRRGFRVAPWEATRRAVSLKAFRTGQAVAATQGVNVPSRQPQPAGSMVSGAWQHVDRGGVRAVQRRAEIGAVDFDANHVRARGQRVKQRDPAMADRLRVTRGATRSFL